MYDHRWGDIEDTHRAFVERFLASLTIGGRVLDAACGTGKYFGMVLDAGRQVVGTDQSAGMQAQARAKHPDVPTQKVGLQELAFDGEFDAVMCVDAMEHVFPEDWPLVLANLRRAVRPGGGYHYYPPLEQVAEWVQRAGLRRLEDGVGDDYYHLLAEAAALAAAP